MMNPTRNVRKSPRAHGSMPMGSTLSLPKSDLDVIVVVVVIVVVIVVIVVVIVVVVVVVVAVAVVVCCWERSLKWFQR